MVAAALVLAGAFHFGVFLVHGGPWEGPVSWRKPTTFGLSFGLTLATVTWVTSYLRLPAVAWLLARTSWPERLRVRGVAVAAAGYGVAIAAALALSLLS